MAFSKLSQADNVGYIIPWKIVAHFLREYDQHGVLPRLLQRRLPVAGHGEHPHARALQGAPAASQSLSDAASTHPAVCAESQHEGLMPLVRSLAVLASLSMARQLRDPADELLTAALADQHWARCPSADFTLSMGVKPWPQGLCFGCSSRPMGQAAWCSRLTPWRRQQKLGDQRRGARDRGCAHR